MGRSGRFHALDVHHAIGNRGHAAAGKGGSGGAKLHRPELGADGGVGVGECGACGTALKLWPLVLWQVLGPVCGGDLQQGIEFFGELHGLAIDGSDGVGEFLLKLVPQRAGGGVVAVHVLGKRGAEEELGAFSRTFGVGSIGGGVFEELLPDAGGGGKISAFEVPLGGARKTVEGSLRREVAVAGAKNASRVVLFDEGRNFSLVRPLPRSWKSYMPDWMAGMVRSFWRT